MDGRIDEIARRASGFGAEEIAERVFAALGAGAPGGADPARFEVFRTNHRARPVGPAPVPAPLPRL